MTCKISGKVLKGKRYGRTIGFPTINLDRKRFSRMKEKPREGVYRGKAVMGGKTYRAGIVIGPKDSRGLSRLEAHLIGFRGNAYGRNATIMPEKFIRKFQKYKSEKDLIEQIKQDLKKC